MLLRPANMAGKRKMEIEGMHILLIEDDLVLADGISRILRGHEMAVDVAHTGTDACALLDRIEVSALVLDIGLPGIDGFEVVRRMRNKGNNTPTLLLTARDAVQDRVHGLELGADDYLVKPFATPELVARIKALVRRGSPKSGEMQIGGLSLDTFSKRLRVNGRVVELSVREWTILEYLLLRVSRVVSKQQIVDAIISWGEDLTLNAIEVYVSRLRTKIADAGVRIRTIRGFGYVLEKTDEQ